MQNITEQVIKEMSSAERLQFIMSCRQKPINGEQLTDDELRLAILALRIERGSGAGRRQSKSAQPQRVITDADL